MQFGVKATKSESREVVKCTYGCNVVMLLLPVHTYHLLVPSMCVHSYLYQHTRYLYCTLILLVLPGAVTGILTSDSGALYEQENKV